MAKSSTSFKPGMSGNPKGRPPKSRALSELLAKGAGIKIAIPPDDPQAEMDAKDVFVQHVWEAVTMGRITFPDGRTLTLDAVDFSTFARLLLNQIDGPPPAAVDVTSGGKPIAPQIIEVIKRPNPNPE